jgi:hypothetical protein
MHKLRTCLHLLAVGAPWPGGKGYENAFELGSLDVGWVGATIDRELFRCPCSCVHRGSISSR